MKGFVSSFCFILFITFLDPAAAFDLEKEAVPTWEELGGSYSEESLQFLKRLPMPQEELSGDALTQLTNEMIYLVDSSSLPDVDLIRIPSYIANAQKDFAWLSKLLTGEFKGNLGPVTLWVLQLFIPKAALPTLKEEAFDVFTSSLATVVVKHYAERLQEEEKQIKNYPIQKKEGGWTPTAPGYTGLNFGSIKTWYLSSSGEFMADIPEKGGAYWKEQCSEVKNAQKGLDSKKREAVFEWAGLTSHDAGSLVKFIYRYLDEKQASLEKKLFVRSLYLSALADSTAASFNSKYTYWVMRPNQRDTNITPLVTVPNHPSYPSGHSTVSATAGTVMSALYPEDANFWTNQAEEAGMSRIWGGLHYFCDHQAGQKLGKQVGLAALQKAIKN